MRHTFHNPACAGGNEQKGESLARFHSSNILQSFLYVVKGALL
jgi:hypothetical protein